MTSAWSLDTDPKAEAVLIEGLRAMGGPRRLARVFELRDAALCLARARLAQTHGERPARELQLRLASLWLDAESMRRAFGWVDPSDHRDES